ncbi:hypothetical protein [Kitasatospora phosalacinea]|uniref:Uncharacterized protein n=1 Tax=Kitasatospora phosalacinea TaxID=2065 RepID=A0ABW6GWR9_9ACTN
MGWTAWENPGWREDERLRAFHPELVDDLAMHRDAARDGSPYAVRLRTSLEHLLEQRPASVGERWSLTRYAFRSEDELYGFLADVHAHFYGDRVEPPIAHGAPPAPARRAAAAG